MNRSMWVTPQSPQHKSLATDRGPITISDQLEGLNCQLANERLGVDITSDRVMCEKLCVICYLRGRHQLQGNWNRDVVWFSYLMKRKIVEY